MTSLPRLRLSLLKIRLSFKRSCRGLDARPAGEHHTRGMSVALIIRGRTCVSSPPGGLACCARVFVTIFPPFRLLIPRRFLALLRGVARVPRREKAAGCEHSPPKNKDPRRDSSAGPPRCHHRRRAAPSSEATPTPQSRAERGVVSGRWATSRTTTCGPHVLQEFPGRLPPAAPGPARGSPRGYTSPAGDPSHLVLLEPSPAGPDAASGTTAGSPPPASQTRLPAALSPHCLAGSRPSHDRNTEPSTPTLSSRLSHTAPSSRGAGPKVRVHRRILLLCPQGPQGGTLAHHLHLWAKLCPSCAHPTSRV